MRYIILIMLPLIANGQVPESTIKSLQYHEYLKLKKSRMVEFMPAKYVKFTLKVGMNRSGISKLTSSVLESLESREALSDIVDDMDSPDIIASIIGYDLRVKFYVHKNFRILLRSQTFSRGNNANNSIGVIWKIPIMKYKPARPIFT